MSGDAESSKLISGGATSNAVKDEAVDASPFQEGEQVLAFHGPCLYAKVLAILLRSGFQGGTNSECTRICSVHSDNESFLDSGLSIQRNPVHFNFLKLGILDFRFFSSWDEWLGVDCLLKRTEENVRKQKELKEKHAVDKNAKLGRLSQDKTKNSIVKLPEMLSCIQIEMETLTELQQRLHDFLRFLQSNQSAFFQSNYQTTSEGLDSAVKREDN
ncbi:UNVERIFIED_CONTAM: hypothetical protein Slati_2585600 [Sesamum latifolium]|uniref:MRG domain-containing protein n=1 Tax=Sesamum latifolium TaxID=2727402 RepID=A0AAW2VTN1_9LAMI